MKLCKQYQVYIFLILLIRYYIYSNIITLAYNFVFCTKGDGGQIYYGQQRVWGTIGFGVSALVGGFLIDWYSGENSVKDYTPAFILSAGMSAFDLLCCSRLKVSY